MSTQAEEFTIGVEEEYQIIDPKTRELCSRVEYILPIAEEAIGEEVQPEAQRSLSAIATPVCQTLADVRAEIIRLRREVIAAAAKDGKQIAAAGTHPFSSWEQQQLTPKERYQGLMRDYQQLTRELIICGCHVHVGRERSLSANRHDQPCSVVVSPNASALRFLAVLAKYGHRLCELSHRDLEQMAYFRSTTDL